MKIAQIAPIAERVPPKKYGGTERVIYALTEALVKKGHKVTLFASGDSVSSARLISVVPKSLREFRFPDIYGSNLYSLMNGGLAYSMNEKFDIIHDHNPGLNLPMASLSRTPVVTTWHGPFSPLTARYFKTFDKVPVVAISKSQKASAPGVNFAATVYNGLDMEHYPFSDQPDKYLLYVGRIDPEKGTHIAIELAVKLKIKLVIAAKLDRDVLHIADYFKKEVEPRLRRHSDLVKWIGEVDEGERNELMKKALCLLHPITWPEPFGLTMIEAMACGCPVVALGLGSVSEVVINGKTGFVASDFTGLAEGVKKIGKISRSACREYSLKNFNSSRMAEGYETVYYNIIQERRRNTNPWTSNHQTKTIFGTLGLTPSSS